MASRPYSIGCTTRYQAVIQSDAIWQAIRAIYTRCGMYGQPPAR